MLPTKSTNTKEATEEISRANLLKIAAWSLTVCSIILVTGVFSFQIATGTPMWNWVFAAKAAGIGSCLVILNTFMHTYVLAKKGANEGREGYTYNWPFAGVPSDTFCPQNSPNYWVAFYAISFGSILLAIVVFGKYFALQEAMKIRECTSSAACLLNDVALGLGLLACAFLIGVAYWTIDLEHRRKHQACVLVAFGGFTLYVILINITYSLAGLTPFLAIHTVSLTNATITTLALACFLFTDNMTSRLGGRADMDRECPTNRFWATAFTFSELGFLLAITLQLGLILPNELDLSVLSAMS